MNETKENAPARVALKPLKSRLARFRSSIYGQVIIIITALSALLFICSGLIFSFVNERHLNEVCLRCGNNISSIVEGSLYYSMLSNDKNGLENILDNINTMPGIEDVNLYDSDGLLVYSTFAEDTMYHSNPNCLDCHSSFDDLFPRTEKSYKIISIDHECTMSKSGNDHRLMLIRAPILNEPSCYTAECHAHGKDEDVLGSIVMRIPLRELDETVKASSSDFFVLAILTTFLLALFLTLFTRRNIRRPLKNIVTASEAVSQGNMEMRLPVTERQLYDMNLVSKAFNEMLDSLQKASGELENWSQQLEYKVQKKSEEISSMQDELIHVERIASLGKLSSSVAHEINNPLSGVLTYTKLVQRLLNKPEVDEKSMESIMKYLDVIESETKRCGDIVKGLLDFSRKDKQDFVKSGLNEILEKSYLLISHQMKISNINFIKELNAEKDLVLCNENQIKQAVIAVLLNAEEAVDQNGEVKIRTSNPEPGKIKIEIIDNGVGISQDDMPHIFEPFFSAKENVSGTGLGLAIVHGIVKNHNATIKAESLPGQGTTISIVFPLAKK